MHLFQGSSLSQKDHAEGNAISLAICFQGFVAHNSGEHHILLLGRQAAEQVVGLVGVMEFFQIGVGAGRVMESLAIVIGFVQDGFGLHGGEASGIDLVQQLKVEMLLDETWQQAEFVALITMDELIEEFPGDIFGIFAQAGNDIWPVRFDEDEGFVDMVGQ